MAIWLAVGFSVAAVGIDLSRAIGMRQLLWSAADSAALAAASRLPDADAARQAALDYIEANLPSATYGAALAPSDIEIGTWDAETQTFVPTSTDASAIRITARLAKSNNNALPTLFGSFFGAESLDLATSAVAGRAGPPCVLTTEPAEPGAMSLKGSSAVEAIGCSVRVNSTARSALEIKGNSSLQASEICVAGTTRDTAGGASPDPNDFCPAMNDPMAALEPPTFGDCDYTGGRYRAARRTLQPGVYCGGLEISSNSDLEMAPGLYVMKDGPFAIGGNSSVQGTDVTIFLTGKDAVVVFKGNSKMKLTAPTTGPLQGVLFFQDRDHGGTHQWDGGAESNLRGVVYLPSGRLVSRSSSEVTPDGSCTVLIARSLEFTSSSRMFIDITSVGCRSALAGPYRQGVILLQ